MKVNGILLLYHQPLLSQRAPTLQEHIFAFAKHSRFKVWNLNVEMGFPTHLWDLEFSVIVLHYTLFATSTYQLNGAFLKYLRACSASHKIAFFQDEYRYCQQRFKFLNDYAIDCVYTLVEPSFFKDTYGKYTRVPTLVSALPGYVSDELIETAKRISHFDLESRPIDVGYRGRQLPYYMGKGAQEKHEIALRFCQMAKPLGLSIDIETEGCSRIYGNRWYRFLAKCKAVLGVESGVSIFDIDDLVRLECERRLSINPRTTFEELWQEVLHPWEDNIPYRTISPRHFEATAFRNVQILYEGNYSAIMKPMVHYVPLKKDFSNFNQVVSALRDRVLLRKIIENAYRDLIASGRYSYRHFIERFDEQLLEQDLKPDIDLEMVQAVNRSLKGVRYADKLGAYWRGMLLYPFPGRQSIGKLLRPMLRMRLEQAPKDSR